MKKQLIPITMAVLLLAACNQEEKKDEKKPKAQEQQEAETMETETEVNPDKNIDALVEVVQDYRSQIESELDGLEQHEMSTAEMREQIKQKWSKIHFYTKEGNVVRVKTYPYSDISTRTEEFYFKDGALVCAVIEDKGTEGKGKDEVEDDKVYYYNNGEVLKEVKSVNEKEYSIKDSDAERLLQEANEYLEIYSGKE